MNLNLKILIFLISLLIFLNFGIEFAQGNTNTISTTPPVSLPSLQEKEPGKLINQIYNFILAISGFLAFAIIVYAGISRILAAGNTSKIAEANQRIQDAFMGIILLLGAYIILRLINPNLVNLKLPELEKIKVKSDTYISDGSGGAGLSEDEARKILATNEIDILNNNKTFLQGIKQGTIDELVRMKKECDAWVSKYYPNHKSINNKNECYILVIGGTENIKHNPGACSHSNGYKIDIAPNPMLDRFIMETYCMKTNKGCTNYDVRSSDGALIYKSPTGSTYAREGNHWDIQITSQCPGK